MTERRIVLTRASDISPQRRPLAHLEDACLAKIRSHRHVSFPELARILDEHGTPSTGDVALFANRPNVMLWGGMSEEFYAVVDELLKSGQVKFDPAHPWTYLIDGVVPRLPIARRPPKAGYRRPHWLPVVFNPAEAQLIDHLTKSLGAVATGSMIDQHFADREL